MYQVGEISEEFAKPIAQIESVKARLYSMTRMNSDDMRDNAALLTLALEAIKPLVTELDKLLSEKQ